LLPSFFFVRIFSNKDSRFFKGSFLFPLALALWLFQACDGSSSFANFFDVSFHYGFSGFLLSFFHFHHFAIFFSQKKESVPKKKNKHCPQKKKKKIKTNKPNSPKKFPLFIDLQ